MVIALFRKRLFMGVDFNPEAIATGDFNIDGKSLVDFERFRSNCVKNRYDQPGQDRNGLSVNSVSSAQRLPYLPGCHAKLVMIKLTLRDFRAVPKLSLSMKRPALQRSIRPAVEDNSGQGHPYLKKRE
jgi:hypothetical protein